MKYAFSPAGLAQLDTLAGKPALYAFDFDGTLAPIVASAYRARVPTDTRLLLEKLAAADAVAVLSGRPLPVLQGRLPRDLSALAGNHGAEMRPGYRSQPDLKRARATVRAWLKQLNSGLAGIEGVWVEAKELSLTVHYRASRNRPAALRAILKVTDSMDPPIRALPGKCVVNLLNPRLPHKGDAVLELLASLRRRKALYVGDDSNDEDVFDLRDPRILTIRVGKLAGSKAKLYLRRQSEIDRLLRYILRAPASTGYLGRREKDRKKNKSEKNQIRK